MRVFSHPDGPSLLRHAGAWLEEAEAENNYLLGACASPRTGAAAPGRLFVSLEDGGAPVGVAVQVPPGPLVVSRLSETASAALAQTLRPQGVSLAHAVGPAEAVERFAALWAEASGTRAVVAMRQGVFELTQVRAPRPVAGFLREVREEDAALLADWGEAFAVECGLPQAEQASMRRASAQWLADRSAAVWEVDGRPVSMAVAQGPTPHGIRVGMVYTPPALRGRGFASACVAALSQRQLDAGRRSCFLYTDLANPTSNRIYQALGYEWVGEARMVRFEPRT